MKWYHLFIKRILKGIVFFLVPLIVFIFILQKAMDLLRKLILPIEEHLPVKRIMGIGMITLICIIIIALICFLAGLLVERKAIKSLIGKLEDNVLLFIPGYSMLRAQTNDMFHEPDSKWQTVLFGESEDWRIGIEVSRQPDGYCTVFFPEPPDGKAGELRLVHESKLKKMDMPVNKLIRIIRKYGEGPGFMTS
jgi:uncharacterized membrane protein